MPSPARAFVVIDARDCVNTDVECGNCTSVLGEKPFDENTTAREESMLRTKYDQSKGVTMFMATPQTTLFGSCNFMLNTLQNGSKSQPIIIHTSLRVNAPNEGVENKYNNLNSVMTYVIDGYKNETADCVVETSEGEFAGSESDSRRAAQFLAANEMLKNAAIKISQSVGTELCEKFIVGRNIKDGAMLDVAIDFAKGKNEALDGCIQIGDGSGISMQNVVSELDKLMEAKRVEIESYTGTYADKTTAPQTTEPATTEPTTTEPTTTAQQTTTVKQTTEPATTEPATTKQTAETTTTTATPEEIATAKTIYDEITKSINVTVTSNAKGQAASVAGIVVGMAVTAACAATAIVAVKKQMCKNACVKKDEEMAVGELPDNESKGVQLTKWAKIDETSPDRNFQSIEMDNLHIENELEPLNATQPLTSNACMGHVATGWVDSITSNRSSKSSRSGGFGGSDGLSGASGLEDEYGGDSTKLIYKSAKGKELRQKKEKQRKADRDGKSFAIMY